MATQNGKLIKGSTGDWEVVIGMEVHAQVTSKSKLFSGASTEFGGAPNSHVSLVDAAMPGMLPVINEECVRQAIRTGLGLKARINLKSVFDRKNYFYPDLPQGYQISQYKQPIVGEGEVIVDVDGGETVTVGIERLHLEQDAGKSLHDQHPNMSAIDLNRSGVALMEIVSKPDLRSADQAKAFLSKLRSILRYLGTCDGAMEKGHLRADVNVSVRKPGAPLGTRCEIKNMNSVRFIGQAIDYEARRQIDIIEDGGKVEQETRLFDPRKRETRSMRSKEEAHDYRYFPDPDLLPLVFSQAYVDDLERHLPELPDEKKARYISAFKLSAYDVGVLVAEPERAAYFEKMIEEGAEPKAAANWLINQYLGRVEANQEVNDEESADQESRRELTTPVGETEPAKPMQTTSPTGPTGYIGHAGARHFTIGWTGPAANSAIVKMVASREITGTSAKELLEIVIQIGPSAGPEDVRNIAEHLQMKQVTDLGVIEKTVDDIIAKNPDKVIDAKTNPKTIMWFVGQVMKASGGKASPQAVNDILKKKLGV
ncbi:MAG TPA: Asp-tRNA(Asn)/Glu-tRNA(Gln) amidotransferase subunit GatB [Pseudolabrys sp.]